MLKARLLLLGAGALWGTFPVVMRRLYTSPGPELAPVFITAWRYGMMALVVLPIYCCSHLRSLEPGARKSLNRAALEIGMLGEAANILSTAGLSLVPAVLAETFLGAVHIFVPLQSALLIGTSSLGARSVYACGLSFCAVLIGTALSTRRARANHDALQARGNGDWWVGPSLLVTAAFFYGLMRVRIEHHIRQGRAAVPLAGARIIAMGSIGLVLLGMDALRGGASASTLGALLEVTRAQWTWLAVSCAFSGLGGSLLHFRAQALVPAANAQPFFALTPVYAAAWARMLLDEPLPPELLATAGVMIAGALLAASDRHGHRLEPKEARSEERELKLVEMEQGAMKVHAV